MYKLRFSAKSVTARSRSSTDDSSKWQEREAPVACQDGKEAEDPTPAYHAAFAGADTLAKGLGQLSITPAQDLTLAKDWRNPKHP